MTNSTTCAAINEFLVHSDFPLPVAEPAFPVSSARPVVTVSRGKAARSECLMRALKRRFSYDVGDGILVLPRHMELFVGNAGDTIIVETKDEHLPMAGLWVIHLGLALCTLFHGGLPLHGAGLELDGHYFAVMAASGAGKSTVSAAMLQHGARFGNDDLVPVRFSESAPVAWPSFSLSPKVHRSALERFGVDWNDLPMAAGKEPEHFLRLTADQRIPSPAPLDAVIILQPLELSPDAIVVERLDEAVAPRHLSRNMHGVWAALSHMDHGILDPLYQRLAAAVPIYTVSYARSFEMLPSLTGAIRQILNDPVSGVKRFPSVGS